ncbi:MAG: peptidylprolyl isomerase, partial [Planctomycetota bacterium]|nr:peptidylprolyl isomerase [Planctomycetota bacterium]
ARLSFRQIYFSQDRRGEQAARDAESLLARLNGASSEVDTAILGDSLMLPADYEGVSEPDVGRDFGNGFAAVLADLPVGRWSGPVESGFGLHLVLVRERQPGSLPALAEVRETVEREWRNARREETGEAFYRGLRERYVVSVEGPEEGDGNGDPKVAEARP